ncbi:MAG TPA: Co2+/Mg2+ efflux protein ApaG [Candidatus Kapabacteria bacterium]|jgi:ApaG protein|nr:Co2+/Mg2+ efflux protein ApaG [Ignavibacteria bacterium]HRE58888.1 Co2+/Mg2+ efflux protein ApaG [Candidatus Kapabacteria bacterium]HRK58854.1 Co2+/Mg2+ efflux protein ApaG [Candidatus Kapabacteria bacterium]
MENQQIFISYSHGVHVEVYPEFLGISTNDNQYNVFSYRITITNESTSTVTLTHRFWKIIDANGHEETIFGEGVVGYTPRLEPSMTFTYSSMCPLRTLWGTMEGYFVMKKDDQTTVDVNIERFFLIHPSLLTKNNENLGTK